MKSNWDGEKGTKMNNAPALLVTAFVLVSCSTASFREQQTDLDVHLKTGKISRSEWFDRSDELVRARFPGDFRVQTFIKARREIIQKVQAGEMQAEEAEIKLTEILEPIRQDYEIRKSQTAAVTGRMEETNEALQNIAIILNSAGDIVRALRR